MKGYRLYGNKKRLLFKTNHRWTRLWISKNVNVKIKCRIMINLYVGFPTFYFTFTIKALYPPKD